MSNAQDQQFKKAVVLAGMGLPNPAPEVVPQEFLGTERPLFEPDDSKRGAVTALPTVSAGGLEIKFNRPGIIVPQPGAIGVYFARALMNEINRWGSLAPGRPIAYHPQSSFFIGTSTDGAISPAGVYNLEFYAKPQGMTWPIFREWVRAWTISNGSDMGNAASASAPVAALSLEIVMKGYDGGSYDPRALPNTGRPVILQAGLDTTTPPGTNNAADVFCVASSAALAIAGAGMLLTPGGNDVWPGGAAFVCEIANLGAATNERFTVVY